MTPQMKSLGIDWLSREEQIELVHEICISLEANENEEPLTESQKREIDRRLEQFSANPRSAAPWDVVEREALARIRK